MIGRSLRAIAALAVCLVCCGLELAYAQDAPKQALRQMDHAVWTARDGAPQAITALAQDRDGTLWIGSDTGLVNFDGQTFRPFKARPDEPELPLGQVNSLLITKAGTIWVGQRGMGTARISSGRVAVFSKADTEPLDLVTHLEEAADGSIWAIANQRMLIRFGTDGAWRRDPVPSSARIGGIFIDSANTLWLAQDGFLHRRPLAQASYTRTEVPAQVVFSFTETADSHIWMSDYDITTSTSRTQQFSLTGGRVRMLPSSHFTNGTVLHVADGSLIVATPTVGVRRFSPEEASMQTDYRSNADPDVFMREHGLSSNLAKVVIIDTHGNIWIGGARGLDRLRPARLTRRFQHHDGDMWSVCASRRGELWFATTSALYRMFGGNQTWLKNPDTANLYALACTDDGHAWFVDPKGIWAVKSGTITALPPIAGVGPFGVMNIAVASDHTVYATVSGPAEVAGGVWRYQEGRWTRLNNEGGLGSAGIAAYVDRRDRLWIGQRAGRAILHTAGEAELFSSAEPGLGQIYTFLDGSRGQFAAGVNGLAVLRDSRVEMLTFADHSFVGGVRGIVEALNGDLWLNAARGFVHVPVKELEAGLASPAYTIKAQMIREGDFAGAPQTLSRNLGTAARDSEGRLWFTTRHGVVNFVPERFSTPSHQPIVTIRSMVADGRPVADHRVLEAGTRTLEIQYLGVNLTAPEGVIFRYRLENYDESWQEAGRRTEAIYTRVPPGTYTFGVMASNGDGVWTDSVSSAPFTVLPSFYQTRWFVAAMVGLAGLMIGLTYRIRVRQIARVMSARFDERLAERTRVARELHDTLMQTVHGSKLVADRALRDTADRDRLVRSLEQLSVWLGQAAAEGRAALQSLRTSTIESNDLAEAFRRAIDECRNDSSAETPFSVQGRARELHPVVRDEVYRIGYEAIRNACVHARARRIDVALGYGHDLTLRIGDDGVGVDATVIETGKEGHFGLRGMRERAEQIGAKCTLESGPGTGTAITLIVPGRVAFRSA